MKPRVLKRKRSRAPQGRVLETPVLIVGGGPVGLITSILLSRFGVRSLLVERHPGTAIHPKARGINHRTMEILRQCGIDEAIRALGLPQEFEQNIIWARSLAGEELERRTPWGRASKDENQVCRPNCHCPQDVMEAVLRDHAESFLLAELRFKTELVSFTQNNKHVEAVVARDGRQERIKARYLVAADGARSGLRQALGISFQGSADINQNLNVHLRADLSALIAGRPAVHYYIEQPELKAVFHTIDGRERWSFNIHLPRGEDPATYTPERCIAAVRRAAGVPDLRVEVLGILPWAISALIAESYRSGRVFLAGDAAHAIPPTGGMGMNTGVQDAHNLAWKLAAVIQGNAAPALLDTYEQERRPYGQTIVEQCRLNAVSRGLIHTAVSSGNGQTARSEFLNEMGLIFGAVYESTAVLPDGTALPTVANPVSDYIPVARPGSRAPHVWLSRQGTRISTLDLFGTRFVLLAGSKGGAWLRAAGGGLRAYVVGGGGVIEDPAGRWERAYGVEPDGAVLVRPDGHVAWRCLRAPKDPASALAHALNAVGMRKIGSDGVAGDHT